MVWKESKLLLIAVLLLPVLCFGQQKQRGFDKEVWQEIREEMDYTDAPPEVEEMEPATPASLPFDSGAVFKILIISLGGLLLVFLIYKILAHRYNWDKKISKVEIEKIEDIEEDLPATALDKFLQEALDSRDYRLAVRIYYLMIIQKLDELSLIKWQREKTNNDYIVETLGQPFNAAFRQATLNFEWIWYGDKPLSEDKFQKLQDQFNELKNNLGEKQ